MGFVTRVAEKARIPSKSEKKWKSTPEKRKTKQANSQKPFIFCLNPYSTGHLEQAV